MAKTTPAAAAEAGTYFVVRPQRMRLLDMLRLLVTRRRLRDCPFVEVYNPPRLVIFPPGADQTDAPTCLALSPSSGKLSGGSWQPGADSCHPLAEPIKKTIQALLAVKEIWEGKEIITNLMFLTSLVKSFTLKLGKELATQLQTGARSFPDKDTYTFRGFGIMVDPTFQMVNTPRNHDNYFEMCVLASKVAYEEKDSAREIVREGLQGRSFKFFNCYNAKTNERSTQAIGFVHEELGKDVIYVAFRGSEVLTQLSDWVVNLDCTQIRMDNNDVVQGKVHEGFMGALGLQKNAPSVSQGFPDQPPSNGERLAYYKIRRWLLGVLAPQQQRRRPVVLRVVGHSQGGALATLFVALLCQKRQQLPNILWVEVVTQGQPRVGDLDFVSWMNRFDREPAAPSLGYKVSCLRLVYRDDIVARIPMRDFSDSWAHYGGCVYLQNWWYTNPQVIKRDQDMPNYNFDQEVDPENLRLDIEQALYNRAVLSEDIYSIIYRLVFYLFTPVGWVEYGHGIACHDLRNYLNAARDIQLGPRGI